MVTAGFPTDSLWPHGLSLLSHLPKGNIIASMTRKVPMAVNTEIRVF